MCPLGFQRSVLTLALLVAQQRRANCAAFVRISPLGRRVTSPIMGVVMSAASFSTWEEGKDTSIAKCVLPLSFDSHKGSSGRVGILGGSERYTGAPYYAAMAALKVGADLAYVFCAQEAAMAIKCYSPELMVASVYSASDFSDVLDEERSGEGPRSEVLISKMVEQIVSMMDRMHVLVIGPGLGRCPMVMKATAKVIEIAKERKLSIVIDADGLFLLTLDEYKNLLVDYDKVVLTPNVVEYRRLEAASGNQLGANKAIVLRKGRYDQIFIPEDSTSSMMTCAEVGGMKRSGGIGDVLAGTLGAFVAWNEILSKREGSTDRVLSCWSASCATKRATKRAFEAHGRAMTAPDVLDALGPTINDMTT